MSDAVAKYHEEEEIGKTYDLRDRQAPVRYIRPYWKLAAAALVLTLIDKHIDKHAAVFHKNGCR